MNLRTLVFAAIGTLAFSSPVMAHPFHSASTGVGVMEGFSHPWFGADHLLAMIAVGLLSVRLGGKAIWALPLAFLGMMAAGGLVGMSGSHARLVETGIALSVVLLGIALVSGRKFPLLVASLSIGGIGLLHGFAHGTEMPVMVNPALYALGFVVATAFLHLLGIAAGVWLTQRKPGAVALQYSGAVLSLAGAGILFGTF